MTLKGKRRKKNWRKKIEIKRNIRPSWKGAGFRRELLRDPVKSFANPCKFRFFHRIFFISPQSYWCFLAFFFFSFSSRISSLEKPTISPTQLFYISIKYQPWITNISRFELTSTTILNSSPPPLSLPLSPRFDWRALTIGDRTKHNERTISKIGYRFIYIENSFPILILSFVHYFNRKKKKREKKKSIHILMESRTGKKHRKMDMLHSYQLWIGRAIGHRATWPTRWSCSTTREPDSFPVWIWGWRPPGHPGRRPDLWARSLRAPPSGSRFPPERRGNDCQEINEPLCVGSLSGSG